MTNQEFVNKLLDIVNNYKTTYAYGTWGQVLTDEIINEKKAQYAWWYDEGNTAYLRKIANQGYFAFDCVGLIKAVLWGWCGDYNNRNGGAKYQSNGVPDLSANGLISACNDVTSNFASIEMGEVVWMEGHVGIYYQDGKVIECSTSFNDKVEITNLNDRNWRKHGKLPYITYNGGGGGDFLPPKGYYGKGDSGANVEKLDAWLSQETQKGTFTNELVELAYANVVGDYYGDYTVEVVKALQLKGLRDGVYNDDIDGYFGELTLKAAEHYGFRP